MAREEEGQLFALAGGGGGEGGEGGANTKHEHEHSPHVVFPESDHQGEYRGDAGKATKTTEYIIIILYVRSCSALYCFVIRPRT